MGYISEKKILKQILVLIGWNLLAHFMQEIRLDDHSNLLEYVHKMQF